MAKHPHRLILINKKTWRCTLEGCAFFVHLGLAHVLIGKQAICWDCGDEFRIDENALKDEQPVCLSCRSLEAGGPSGDEISDKISQDFEIKLAMGKAGVKHISELSPITINQLKSKHKVSDEMIAEFMSRPKSEIKDKIESEIAHAPDCDSFNGGDCNCM